MINRPFILAIYALALFQGCLSALSNRTIDDFNGDAVTGVIPVYDPPNGWNAVVVSTVVFSTFNSVSAEQRR
jgi:hypothetical protein